MILYENNISPLAFVESLDQQSQNRDYAYGQIVPLCMPVNYIIPFQVCVSSTITAISKVYLCNVNDLTETDITSKLTSLSVITEDGYNIIKYNPRDTLLVDSLPEGEYYLRIESSNGLMLYSEIIALTSSYIDYTRIEYSNTVDLKPNFGIISFSDGFKFVVFINTQLGRPDYTFEEESVTRLGYTYEEVKTSKKKYNFNFTALEYLCDALRVISLCDTRKVSDKYGDHYPNTFSTTMSWLDQGYLAEVKASFEADNIIANI